MGRSHLTIDETEKLRCFELTQRRVTASGTMVSAWSFAHIVVVLALAK
jgi:hypothetical protein